MTSVETGGQDRPTLSADEINQTVLEGVLAEPVEIRVTPAGRTVATLMVEHHSQAKDIEPIQRLEVSMAVMAVGPLGDRCRDLVQGSRLRVEGRLNQRRWIRDGKVRWGRTELVAQRIGLLELPQTVDNPDGQ